MFTEQSLHDQPALVKALMGLPAAEFWTLIQQMTDQFTTYIQQQRQRPDRQRASGAGRTPDLPLAIRTALVLSYLRLHIPQATVAALFSGATQSDVSRDLRRLLPLIQHCLPCPQVWEEVADAAPDAPASSLSLDDLTDGRVLLDATEQPVARPVIPAQQKAYYSGKKHDHTLKTQIVTDGAHHIRAISVAVPGARHDKALSDDLHTLDRLPAGCEVAADKGDQGLVTQVPLVQVLEVHSGAEQLVPRLVAQTPFKTPKGGHPAGQGDPDSRLQRGQPGGGARQEHRHTLLQRRFEVQPGGAVLAIAAHGHPDLPPADQEQQPFGHDPRQ